MIEKKIKNNLNMCKKFILRTCRDLLPLEAEGPAAGELLSPEPGFWSPPPRTLTNEPLALDMTSSNETESLIRVFSGSFCKIWECL